MESATLFLMCYSRTQCKLFARAEFNWLTWFPYSIFPQHGNLNIFNARSCPILSSFNHWTLDGQSLVSCWVRALFLKQIKRSHKDFLTNTTEQKFPILPAIAERLKECNNIFKLLTIIIVKMQLFVIVSRVGCVVKYSSLLVHLGK